MENDVDWRDLPVPFTKYRISPDGRVYDVKLRRFVLFHINGGYPRIKLRDNTGRCTTIALHKLLAETFIPNPQNLPIVDHINRNKMDYRLKNLRWVSHRDSGLNRRRWNAKGCKIQQITLDGLLVATYKSITEAAIAFGTCEDTIAKYSKTPPHIYKEFIWLRTTFQDNTGELWRIVEHPAIPPDVYVSDQGRIRRGNKILQPTLNANGYLRISFGNSVRRGYYVHRLVMLMFVGPSKLQVNHKNKDRRDNRLCNLEYLTISDHMKHTSTGRKSSGYATSKKVVRIDENGKIIEQYPSLSTAAKSLDCSISCVSKACCGLTRSARGHILKYEDISDLPDRLCYSGSHPKSVEQFSKDGMLITKFRSIADAAFCTGISASGISAACLGKIKTSGGYRWSFS